MLRVNVIMELWECENGGVLLLLMRGMVERWEVGQRARAQLYTKSSTNVNGDITRSCTLPARSWHSGLLSLLHACCNLLQRR
jgi:hypothetical protein